MLAMLFLLTGCPSEEDPDPKPQPPPAPAPPPPPPKLPPNVADAVVLELFKKKKLKFRRPDQLEKQLEDQHKGYFIRRRTRELLKLNPAWGSNLDQLKQRVESEFDAVQTYLTTLLATDHLGGAVEAGSPPRGAQTTEWVPSPIKHLNLEDAAYATIHTSDGQAKIQTARLVLFRRRRVTAIVWRAAAIQDAVWSPSGAQLGATGALLTKPGGGTALDELVDRRLRTVERMTTQVATHNYINGGYTREGGETEPTEHAKLNVTGEHSWFDGFRGRPFEYPRVKTTPPVLAVVGSVASADSQPFDGTHTWRFGKGNGRLEYNVPPTGLQLRAELMPHWRQRFKVNRQDSYDVNLIPVTPVTPSAAVDLLWQSKFNWWDRSWLFCDHVLSALHIEALLFACRRRGKESVFDTMATPLEFVQLSSHVNERKEERLMSGTGNDTFFDNIDLSEGDLQVGDQLIVWNSFVYSYIADGEWQLENALVMDLRSDPDTGGIIREKLTLQGHGTQARPYPRYQNTILEPLTAALKTLHAEIEAQPAGTTSFTYHPVETTVVRWEPFATFSSPGAWWLVITLQKRNIGFDNVNAAKQALPRAIVVADVSNPTHPFPLVINEPFVLYPLYLPSLGDNLKGVPNSWTYYFQNHTTKIPRSQLQKIRVEGDLLPTLFRHGEANPLPIVRPKVSL